MIYEDRIIDKDVEELSMWLKGFLNVVKKKCKFHILCIRIKIK